MTERGESPCTVDLKIRYFRKILQIISHLSFKTYTYTHGLCTFATEKYSPSAPGPDLSFSCFITESTTCCSEVSKYVLDSNTKSSGRQRKSEGGTGKETGIQDKNREEDVNRDRNRDRDKDEDTNSDKAKSSHWDREGERARENTGKETGR